jgi:divalent metal cation (Fe/Co/Zn/Cd) transporter
MKFLKKFWNWLLGQTTIDEKIEAKVTEVKEKVAEVKEAIEKVVEETKDVVVAIKPKKKRYYKPKAKKQ